MAANWTRLSRDDTLKALDQLSGQKDAILFTRETTEVSARTLPFYSRWRLLRLVNYATMPVFTILYLTDGESYLPIDGTATPIYETNAKDPIQLNEMTVIPYLEFFLANVQGPDGDVFLIKDPKRTPLLQTLATDQREKIAEIFKPIRLGRDAQTGTYKMTATLYYAGGLVSAAIDISPHGAIAFTEQKMLLSGIHFPPDPYGSQAWLEG